MKKATCFSCIFFLAMLTFAQANEKVENFELKDLISGQNKSLADFSQMDCIVLIFTSTACPYDQSYTDRISDLHKSLLENKKKVQFLLILTDQQTDSLKISSDFPGGNKIPVLHDKELVLSTKLKAFKTPEAYVLHKVLGNFIVKYYGAIDDNPQLAEDVTHFFLKEAINEILSGKSPEAVYHKPIGCMIKK